MHMDTVTDSIKKAVQDSGLSIRNLSKLSGVPRIPLNRFMNGQTELRLSMVDLLAEFFGLELKPVEKKKKRGNK